MPFDGEPISGANGHKFWPGEKYKGYWIVPHEYPDGERSYLVGDPKKKAWIYENTRMEDCGAFIDVQVLAKKYRRRK